MTLRLLWTLYRGKLLLTYALFCVENLLMLAQPLVLGLAINDLLQSSYRGLIIFLGQHLAHLLIGTLRQMYDTRAFTGITARLSADLVMDQRGREIPVSQVAARSALSRHYVEFFEREVPMVFRALFRVVGALALLAWYDPWLVPICLALIVPAWVLNKIYARKTLHLNGKLHDQLEREIDVIERGRTGEVQEHYRQVGRWRIRLSDWEAINFGLMELFVMGLLLGTLLRVGLSAAAPGDIFAVFRYVMMFLMGLDSIPRLVEQLSRLRDVGRRLQPAESGAGG